MKIRKILIMLIIAVPFLILGSSAMAQRPDDLVVSDARFVEDVNRNFNFMSYNSGGGRRAPFTTSIVQEVSAVFYNRGNKVIDQVSWEFIVYQDASKTKINRIYTAGSKTEILPGESVRLNKTGLLSDTSQYQEVKVFQIRYADGTVWKGDKIKK